jgi:hypothetical protein
VPVRAPPPRGAEVARFHFACRLRVLPNVHRGASFGSSATDSDMAASVHRPAFFDRGGFVDRGGFLPGEVFAVLVA